MIRINPSINYFQTKLLKCQNKYQEIANIADKYWNQDLPWPPARLFFYAYLHTGNYRKAHHIANHVKEKSKIIWRAYWLHGLLSATGGDNTLALAYADSLNQLSRETYVPKVYIASIYAAVGDSAEMYRNLDLALSRGEIEIHYIKKIPFFQYQKEARFQEIWGKAWIPRNQGE